VGRDAHRQQDRATRTQALGRLGGSLDRRSFPAHHHLSGGVAVCDREHADGLTRGDEVGESGVLEPDDRSHRPVTCRRLCQAAPLAHQSYRVGEVHHASGHHRAVLAHRVAGVEAGFR
jgi:hypothetical protein